MHSWCVESEKWVEIFFHHWTSEKIRFLYFFLHKSWIWQTLGHVTKKKNIAIFIMLQKNAFGQKNFWISCKGSKVPYWQKWKVAKMALLNPCMKFKFFFCQKTSFEALWKCHVQKITFSRVQQIQDLGQSKYKLRPFSKRTHRILKILYFRVSMNL